MIEPLIMKLWPVSRCFRARQLVVLSVTGMFSPIVCLLFTGLLKLQGAIGEGFVGNK